MIEIKNMYCTLWPEQDIGLTAYEKHLYVALCALYRNGYTYISFNQMNRAMGSNADANGGAKDKIRGGIDKFEHKMITVSDDCKHSDYLLQGFYTTRQNQYNNEPYPVYHITKQPAMLNKWWGAKTLVKGNIFDTGLRLDNSVVLLEEWILQKALRDEAFSYDEACDDCGISDKDTLARAKNLYIPTIYSHYGECGLNPKIRVDEPVEKQTTLYDEEKEKEKMSGKGFENIGEPKGYFGNKKLYDLQQVADASGVSRSALYDRAKNGKFEIIKFGTQVAVTEDVAKEICEHPEVKKRTKIKIEPAAQFGTIKAYTPADIAEAYGLKPSDIYNRAHAGKIKSFKIDGSVLIMGSELKKLLVDMGVA